MSLLKKPVIHCVSPPVSGAPSHPLLYYKKEKQLCPRHLLVCLFAFTSRHQLLTEAWCRACGHTSGKQWSKGECLILKMMTTQQLLLLLLWGLFFMLWCLAIKRIWNIGCRQKGEICGNRTTAAQQKIKDRSRRRSNSSSRDLGEVNVFPGSCCPHLPLLPPLLLRLFFFLILPYPLQAQAREPTRVD